MEKITIKAYAVKHKLSIFNVMKMVKSEKLKTIVEEENGKEMTYILLDEVIEKEVKKSIVPLTERESATIKEELKHLREEIIILKNEIETLKKAIP
ncbi:hypothetical protein C9925_00115 [cyanobacterium G8-9]|nr:hypothetical protein C9925_00115 [cyanobacterium G8-9]